MRCELDERLGLSALIGRRTVAHGLYVARMTSINMPERVNRSKSDPISLDTASTTMTAAKEVDDDRTQAEADSWQ